MVVYIKLFFIKFKKTLKIILKIILVCEKVFVINKIDKWLVLGIYK